MQWVSVKERLPKEAVEVLVFDEVIMLGIYWGDIDRHNEWCIGNRFTTKVTHWMPLPEPPTSHKNKDI